MEKANKKISILIAILVVAILGLAGYLVYDKILNKNSNPQNTIENQTSGILGKYAYYGVWNNVADLHVELELNSNNTFALSLGYASDGGDFYGNYTLDGEKLTLKATLRNASNANLSLEENNDTFDCTYDKTNNTITLNKWNYSYNNGSKIVKETKTEYNGILTKVNSFKHLSNNYLNLDANDENILVFPITKKVNNKEVNIDVKFKNGGNYEVFVNNVKVDKVSSSSNFIAFDSSATLVNKLARATSIREDIFDSIGQITTDKNYLYFKTYGYSPAGSPGIDLYLVNENGKVIGKENIVMSGQSISNTKGCQDSLYKQEEHLTNINVDWTKSYYIGNDAIYFLKQDTADKVKEYKITIKNDTVTKSVINTCSAEISGAVS